MIEDKFIIIYSTFSNKEEATNISSKLVDDGDVACANIFPPHTAIYKWNNEICNDQEVSAIFKTKKSNFDKVKDSIIKLHSYDCPCVVSWDIDNANSPYAQFILDMTST